MDSAILLLVEAALAFYLTGALAGLVLMRCERAVGPCAFVCELAGSATGTVAAVWGLWREAVTGAPSLESAITELSTRLEKMARIENAGVQTFGTDRGVEEVRNGVFPGPCNAKSVGPTSCHSIKRR
jgi:hypothetical protein